MMNHGNGWMGGSGWMGGGMWIWTMIGVVALILLVVLINKVSAKQERIRALPALRKR